MSETKVCTKCRTAKPIELFPWGKDPRLKAGGSYKSECKACACERAKKWQDENRERAWENSKNWRLENKDRWLGHVKRATKKRMAALAAQTPAWADLAKIEEVYAAARALREAGHDAEVDHIVALQGVDASGLHVHWNLQIVTRRQNLQKRNRSNRDAYDVIDAWDTYCTLA